MTLPILLITGYYGMNFDNLPFPHSKYGVFIATGIMAALAAVLLLCVQADRVVLSGCGEVKPGYIFDGDRWVA